MAYAKGTKVAVGQSRAELERILARYGADAFSYGQDGERAIVAFRADGRHVKLEVPVPPLSEFAHTPTQTRSPSAQATAREQRVRELWRALCLVVKAKLEAVEAGIESFDQAFLPYILLPDGSTAGEFLLPQVAEAYETGTMPSLLPASQPALARGDPSDPAALEAAYHR